MPAKDPIIRASEIGHYAFCARAWWLGRVKGRPSANLATMRRGTLKHTSHGRSVERYHLLRRAGTVLIVLAATSLNVWLLLSLGR